MSKLDVSGAIQLRTRPTARHDAYELLGQPSHGAILLTGEHASNRVPAPWRLRPADRILLQSHWGYDIGVRHLLEGMVHALGAFGVASRYSRLLIDPNRDPLDPTAVLRGTSDGRPPFNRRVNLAARVDRFHAPYHHVIDAAITSWKPRFLLSVHSFTPELHGRRRPMEAGVLFDRDEALALRLVESMNAEGMITAANEPYSGMDGLIYSAARHGRKHGLAYLEVELRQDLLQNRHRAHHTGARVARAIQAVGI